MTGYNDETCYCKECDCDYRFDNNNHYGYNNCCFSCGENKYEEYLEEQEELKKKKEINFNDLPCDIKNLIFGNNRTWNSEINQGQKLHDFWDEWGQEYEDDVEDFFDDELISSPYWDELKIKEKINIYKRHQRMIMRQRSIECDGSALDEDYEIGVY